MNSDILQVKYLGKKKKKKSLLDNVKDKKNKMKSKY